MKDALLGAMTRPDDLSRRKFVLQTTAALATSAAAFGSLPRLAKGDESGAESARKPLQGKVAVVTGAARGIGRAIAVRLAEDGAEVMGIDIAGPISSASEASPATRKDLEETERLVKAQARRFTPVVADVRNLKALRDASAKIEKEWGIIGLMKSLALEMGEYQITVNAVIPGLIDTPLTRNPTRWRALIGQTGVKPPEHP